MVYPIPRLNFGAKLKIKARLKNSLRNEKDFVKA